MVRAIQVFFARLAYEKANWEYMDYMAMPAGQGWQAGMANILHHQLILRERRLSHLMNG